MRETDVPSSTGAPAAMRAVADGVYEPGAEVARGMGLVDERLDALAGLGGAAALERRAAALQLLGDVEAAQAHSLYQVALATLEERARRLPNDPVIREKVAKLELGLADVDGSR